MNILLTNDDGIASQGVRILAKALSDAAKVWACVPKEQQSAVSHMITVRESLTVREESIDGVQRAWSVDGKPVDCVKLAFLSLLEEPIDLVISGINEGSNLGTDTLYSGTVAGAMEGALHDKPAMALSLLTHHIEREPDYAQAAQIAVHLVKLWEAGSLPIAPRYVLNVNIPALPQGEIRGYKACRLGIQRYSDIYEELDTSGELNERAESLPLRFHLKGERLPSYDNDPSVDIVAVDDGYVTLTPLSADRTDYPMLHDLEKYFPG